MIEPRNAKQHENIKNGRCGIANALALVAKSGQCTMHKADLPPIGDGDQPQPYATDQLRGEDDHQHHSFARSWQAQQ